MRGHTMGRRLGRVVAVVALGIAVSFTTGTAAQAAHAWVTVGDDVPVVLPVDKLDYNDSIDAPVSLFDFSWN
ncbi:hypothetical protein O7623_17235 [Solwaraspora sp. WMMD791]|uniref:hypothetical protein n=1 Tax=Solwaraspora sp. WMMD791 TaxID=3016086 RepID=UPI00249C27E7|nr:hypothetical protein [Solwaraspora sp. WMMD791]WFE25156.1 hypothetical protein O7623_17235 [Solwaraspora sp. WMMD791]